MTKKEFDKLFKEAVSYSFRKATGGWVGDNLESLKDSLIKSLSEYIEIEPELLPCPFCGHDVEVVKYGRINEIYCKGCPATMYFPPDIHKGDEDCIEMWNNRNIKNN